MAKITPRFVKRGEKTGYFRSVDPVPTDIGILRGNSLDNSVAFSLSVFTGNDENCTESRVEIELSAEDIDRIFNFKESVKNKRPLSHALTRAIVSVNGDRVKVTGWWNDGVWHNAEDIPLACETDRPLSYVDVETCRLMARLCIPEIQIGETKYELWI